MTRRSYLLGLTGSIGMGKSTTAGFFRDCGVPVWDADAAVHRIYGEGGAGVPAIARLCPEATVGGNVDRNVLRAAILEHPELLEKVEAAVHPLVALDRQAFLAANLGAPLVVLDIPLLYETGAENWLDGVLVVTAAPEVQRARVLERPGMTEASFAAMVAKQIPDAKKRARADYIIDTGLGLDAARSDVKALVEKLAGEKDA